MIFLNAPLDLQQSPAYEAALKLLQERHGADHVAADRDLFGSMKSYQKSWKQVYDPEQAASLYVLAREDGTIGVGVYRQWKRLSKKHGVPATLLLPDGGAVVEVGPFSVTRLEEAEATDQVFAVVSPHPAAAGPQGAGMERIIGSSTQQEQEAPQVAVTARPSEYREQSGG